MWLRDFIFTVSCPGMSQMAYQCVFFVTPSLLAEQVSSSDGKCASDVTSHKVVEQRGARGLQLHVSFDREIWSVRPSKVHKKLCLHNECPKALLTTVSLQHIRRV